MNMKVAPYASLIGTTKQTLYTLIKRGEVVVVYVNGKRMVDVEKSTERLRSLGKIDEHGKYLPRGRSVKTVEDINGRNELPMDGEIEVNTKPTKRNLDSYTPPARKKKEDTSDKSVAEVGEVLIDENMPEDLKEMLDSAYNPKDMVQIINTYWQGRKNRQAYEREKRISILMSEARAVEDMIFTEASERFGNLHVDMRNKFPNLDPGVYEWLKQSVDNIKESMQEIACVD